MKEVYQSTHVTFGDLEPGHTYYFRLRADISGRMSILTKPISAETYKIGASCTPTFVHVPAIANWVKVVDEQRYVWYRSLGAHAHASITIRPLSLMTLYQEPYVEQHSSQLHNLRVWLRVHKRGSMMLYTVGELNPKGTESNAAYTSSLKF